LTVLVQLLLELELLLSSHGNFFDLGNEAVQLELLEVADFHFLLLDGGTDELDNLVPVFREDGLTGEAANKRQVLAEVIDVLLEGASDLGDIGMVLVELLGE